MKHTKITLSRLCLLFILAILPIPLLSACGSAETLQDPEVASISVIYTPALRPMVPAFQTCAREQPQTVLFTQELPASSLSSTSAGLVFRLGEPDEDLSYAVQVAQETLTVIVNADNPLESLTAEELRRIFSGEIKNWDEIGEFDANIQVWVYSKGDEITRIVDQTLLFGQNRSTEALLAADPAAMISGVESAPGATGIVPSAWLKQEPQDKMQVKTVRLERALSISFRQPVLAITPGEPQGTERDFLSCLQNGSGQTVLKERYNP
jgi:hypothetical protein